MGRLLAAVGQVMEGWTCVREIGPPMRRITLFVFHARIERERGRRAATSCTPTKGLVDEFYVMVSPLSAALALAEAMKARLEAAQAT